MCLISLYSEGKNENGSWGFWDDLSENLLLERKNVNNALEDALEGYKEPSINALEKGDIMEKCIKGL